MIDLENEVLAHRWLYYVLATQVLSDVDYDRLECEARAALPETSPVHRCGSDLRESYPVAAVARAEELLKRA